MTRKTLPRLGAYDVQECTADNWGTQYFRVLNRHLDRLETVIVLKPRIGVNPEAAAAFLNSYRKLALIRHPNIARVYDVGIFRKNLYYVALEHVKGAPLNTLSTGPQAFSVLSVIRWITQIADAVDALSDNKIYPVQLGLQDIIITKEGQAVLVDIQTEQLPGINLRRTVYPYPEQATGRLDERSVVYNMGIILYELLSGMMFNPSSERKYAAELPEYLRAIIEKCLHIDPDNRFQNSKALIHALSSGPARGGKTRSTLQKMMVSASLIALCLFFLRKGDFDTNSSPVQPDTKAQMEMMIPVLDASDTPPGVIKMLLKHTAFQPIITQLSIERDKGNLTFGRREDFLDPDKCFIFIFGKTEGTLIAALTPGKQERIDLLTDKPVRFVENDLLDKAAIWILPAG